MTRVNDSTDTPIVTVLSDRSALEPRLRDDAACVASAATAAMRPDRLLLAFLALMLLWAAGSVWDAVQEPELSLAVNTGVDGVLGDLIRQLPEERRSEAMDEIHRQRGPFEYLLESAKIGATTSLHGLLELDANAALRGVTEGIVRPIRVLWSVDRGFLVVIGSWTLLVLGVLGGAMCRSDVERLAREREVPLMAATRWAVKEWRRLWGVGMLPPVMVAMLLAPIAFVLGTVSLIPGLDVLVALLWGVALLLGFAAAIVMTAWLVGLPLILPAAAIEAGDPVEVTVRVATLLRRRPFRALFLAGTAIIAGLVAWMVIATIVVFTLSGAADALQVFDPIAPIARPAWPTLVLGIDPGTSEIDGASVTWGATSRLSSQVIGWWNLLVVLVARAWILGFSLLAAGRIYLCLRRSVERLPFEDLGEPGPLG